MTTAYYLYSALIAGFFPARYAMIWFGLTLLSFHAGVAVSYLLWDAVGFRAAWLCLIPILAAFGMVRRSVRTAHDAETKPVR